MSKSLKPNPFLGKILSFSNNLTWSRVIGLIGERGSSTNVGIIWDESADTWAAVNTSDTGTTAGNVTIASYANMKAGFPNSAKNKAKRARRARG